MGGTGYPTRRIAPAHALLGAVALLALVVVPVAATASDSTGPDAAASAGVKKKVKKLKKRVKGLEGRLIELEAEQGGQRPPTGPASGDLAGSYPGPAIAGDAVDSAKVAPDSLRGPDIDESSLGQVPSAGSASNANAVDGVDAANVEYKSDVDSTPTTILNLPGLQLRASCAGGNLQVQALTSVDNALLNSGWLSLLSGDVVNRISVADFDAGQPFAILPNNADQQAGHTEYARPGTGLGFLISHEVSVTWMAEEDALGFDCVFTGHAFGSA